MCRSFRSVEPRGMRSSVERSMVPFGYVVKQIPAASERLFNFSGRTNG
jgi:hypothetical protein